MSAWSQQACLPRFPGFGREGQLEIPHSTLILWGKQISLCFLKIFGNRGSQAGEYRGGVSPPPSQTWWGKEYGQGQELGSPAGRLSKAPQVLCATRAGSVCGSTTRGTRTAGHSGLGGRSNGVFQFYLFLTAIVRSQISSTPCAKIMTSPGSCTMSSPMCWFSQAITTTACLPGMRLAT